jgi:hypothetical protein
MILGDVPAGQAHPDRPIEPTGPRRQGGQQRLSQNEALAGRGHRSKPQFASLISPVQYHPPGKYRPFVPIPIKHSDELLS